jgi:hypothetical protein
MSLLRPALTLIAAALMLPALAQPLPAYAAPYQGSQPGLSDSQDATKSTQDTSGKNQDPITGRTVKDSSVLDYVNSGYQFLAVIGGLMAILMLIYAGYRYMTSYGDPEKISDAKDIVEKALIGLALLILAAVILNTINPRTASDPCKPHYNNKGENTNTQCGDIDFSKPNGGN